MNFSQRTALLAAANLGLLAAAQAGTLTGFPFADEELTYTLKWPGGLTLGEGHLKAKHGATAWDFALSLDGSIPGFAVKDDYKANAPGDLCTAVFERTSTHGSKKTAEKETVDTASNTVKRENTSSGGASGQFTVAPCERDALTFLFYSRRELGQGRVPAAEEIVFGGLYRAQMDYAGAETVSVSGKAEISDKVAVSIKGPASALHFDMYFARDAARTPLLIKVPFALGTFSMELVR
jgi:hypothetical protein